MSKRIFTKKQVEELLNNPHVTVCREKTFSYSKVFKALAVKKFQEGLTTSQIFKEAGFNLETIGKEKPKQLIRAWRKIYELKGDAGLSVEQRGRNTKGCGRPKTKGITDADKFERMEATIAYLKAENAFLAKLRAARKE